jgi:hypothetical protein
MGCLLSINPVKLLLRNVPMYTLALLLGGRASVFAHWQFENHSPTVNDPFGSFLARKNGSKYPTFCSARFDRIRWMSHYVENVRRAKQLSYAPKIRDPFHLQNAIHLVLRGYELAHDHVLSRNSADPDESMVLQKTARRLAAQNFGVGLKPNLVRTGHPFGG